jgi:hypothetical protein
MKVISLSLIRNKNFTGIIIENYCGDICFYKNGKIHNENGPAIFYKGNIKAWCYDGWQYGFDNEFTNKTWKEKVEYLKREEELKIFI